MQATIALGYHITWRHRPRRKLLNPLSLKLCVSSTHVCQNSREHKWQEAVFALILFWDTKRMEANIHMRQSAKEAELYDNLRVEIELLKGLCLTTPPLHV